MSRYHWLLVEWMDERNVFPSYGIVNVSALVNEENDLHPGKITFARAKHGNSARRAQILRISDDKHHLKEHKLLLERQDHQVKNMLSLCMRTIKEIKTDPLMNSLNMSHQTTSNNTGSEVLQDNKHSSSSSDSDEELQEENTRQPPRTHVKTLTQTKRLTDYYNNGRVTPASHNTQTRRSVASSNPLPASSNKKETSKLTFDQATQTDTMPTQVPVEKIEHMEAILNCLYQQFLNLVSRLQLNCEDYSTYNSEVDRHGAAESDREINNVHEQNVDDTNGEHILRNTVEPEDFHKEGDAKTLQVRRVSAHTTNAVEQSNPFPTDMIPIGHGHAMIPARLMDEIDWDSHSTATRQLLQAVFPRKVLATHSLTGKKSPAFAHLPVKKCLDPNLVEDIVDTVSERCRVPKRCVRQIITIKCVDEAKLYRNRIKSKSLNQEAVGQDDQENVAPSPVTSRVSSNGSG